MFKPFFKPVLSSLFLAGALLFSSCEKEPDPVATEPEIPTTPGAKGPYEHGVFVMNEGTMAGGSVSFYDRNSKLVKSDLFQDVNKRPLGTYPQAMTIHNDKAYLIVGGSDKVEVTDANTFQSAGEITGLQLPRYMAVANNKGYVTEWISFNANGRVAVINLENNTVTKTIPAGNTPDEILAVNGKVYVVNSGENTVTVINATTDAVEKTLTVGDAPNSLIVDAGNKLWVLCGGKKNYNPDWTLNLSTSTAGSLVRIDLASNTVEATLPFTSVAAMPDYLTTNRAGNKLYFKDQNGIYELATAATAFNPTKLVSRNFYGLGVDPETGFIYGADAGAFTANGNVIRYSPTGSPLDSFTVGVAPNGFYFR